MIGFYLQHFLDSPSTIATWAALMLLAAIVTALAPRRRALVFATGASLALIGGLTLAPAGGWTTFDLTDDPVAAVVSMLHLQPADLLAWRSADGPANIVLFVPLGLTLGLLLRRPFGAAALGVALSVAIESYQAATGTRVGAAADIVANAMGAAIGAALAAGLLLIGRLSGAARRHRRCDAQPANRATRVSVNQP